MEDCTSVSSSMCPSWSSSDEAVVKSSTTTSTTMDTKSSSLHNGSTTADTKSSTSTRRPLEEEPPQPQPPQSMTNNKNTNKKQRIPKVKIYCDLDGVLVDFNRGVMQLTNGQHPDRMPVGKMWAAVSRKKKFFQQLSWTRDGKQLWHAIQQLRPDTFDICILTGVPSNEPQIIGQQKATWCRRELGIDVHHRDMAGLERKQNVHKQVVVGTSNNNKRNDKVNVISCWSKFKYKECKNPGDILIDDRQKFQHDWEQAGGIFVHHVKTETTLIKLRELGIINDNPGEEADDDDDDDDDDDGDELQEDECHIHKSEANANNPREKQRPPRPRDSLEDERPETPW